MATFKHTKSLHGMPCLQSDDITDEERNVVRRIISNTYTASVDYQLRQPTGAFLQCDCENFIMIEFWQNNPASIRAYTLHVVASVKAETGIDQTLIRE